MVVLSLVVLSYLMMACVSVVSRKRSRFQVGDAVDKYKEKILKERYAFNVGVLMGKDRIDVPVRYFRLNRPDHYGIKPSTIFVIDKDAQQNTLSLSLFYIEMLIFLLKNP